MARKENYHHEVAYRKTKRGNLSRTLDRIRRDSRKIGKECDLDLDYLESIATDECPIFKTPFVWGQSKKVSDETASIDKIIPELGYIKGNVVFISFLANKIKQNVTEKELYAVADWLHDERKKVLNAYKGQFTSIPETNGRKGQSATEHRALHGAGVGEDCDGSHHHIRE